MAVAFVTGPVRSGKSRLAIRMAQQHSDDVCYIATAAHDENDKEWQSRIERHRADRPVAWRTFESANAPVEALYDLLRSSSAEQSFVVDSLGTWLTSQLPTVDTATDLPQLEERLIAQGLAFVEAICAASGRVIVVSEETGWSIVPAYPAARVFRDVLGRLNQTLAQRSQQAYLVVCGHAIDIKMGVPVETWHP